MDPQVAVGVQLAMIRFRPYRRSWSPSASAGWLCAIVVGLWPTFIVARQAQPPVPLPRELRAHLQDGRFDVVSSLSGLSGAVRAELRTLFNSKTLDIADPPTSFRVPARGAAARRTLAAAGCSRSDCLIYYALNGSARAWRVVLIHWTPETTQLEWGGTAPGNLGTIDEVRSAVLSGLIKGSAGPW
jgi:hypothetical protein